MLRRQTKHLWSFVIPLLWNSNSPEPRPLYVSEVMSKYRFPCPFPAEREPSDVGVWQGLLPGTAI